MKFKNLVLAAVLTLASLSSIQHANADGSEITGGFGENCSISAISCNNGKVLSCWSKVLNYQSRAMCIRTIKGCNAMVRCETFNPDGSKASSFVDKCY